MKTNKYQIKCKKCGAMIEPGDGLIYETYEGRDGGCDENSHWEGMCAYATECAERVIESGTSPDALLEIINDGENYTTEMRQAARESYERTARLMSGPVTKMTDEQKFSAWMR